MREADQTKYTRENTKDCRSINQARSKTLEDGDTDPPAGLDLYRTSKRNNR